MAPDLEDNPLEQLVELLVYAPIGLLYEYPDVLPRLIKRGKSQVQLAKFAGQLALKQNRSSEKTGDGGAPVSPDVLVDGLARLITEVGSMIGLAPSDPQTTSSSNSGGSSRPTQAKPSTETATPDTASVIDDAVEADDPPPTSRLPIANYGNLTAKEVVFLLEDLTVSQLKRVRTYEQDHRNRKTVLTKIDRLLS